MQFYASIRPTREGEFALQTDTLFYVNSTQVKTEAAALRLALMSGLALPEDVIAWADRTIEDEATPHISIIELALATDESADRLALRLSEISGESPPDGAIRILLKGLSERLDHGADPRDVAEHLYRLTRTSEWPEDLFGTEPYWLDDLFQPESAYGGTYYEEALAALRAYLTKHTTKASARSILKRHDDLARESACRSDVDDSKSS